MPEMAKKPISCVKSTTSPTPKSSRNCTKLRRPASVSACWCGATVPWSPESDRIEIRGIIDRYLEHARILIFCNGGDEQYYIGSADWMPRNIDHRIEAYAPVYDPEIRRELKTIVEFGLADNVAARIVDGTGRNRIYDNGEPPETCNF